MTRLEGRYLLITGASSWLGEAIAVPMTRDGAGSSMWISELAAIYVVLGMVFATWFVIAGAERLDPAVKGAGAGFRLLIAPASAALWPVLLVRSLRRHA